MKRRMIAFLLCLAMVLSMVPAGFAQETAAEDPLEETVAPGEAITEPTEETTAPTEAPTEEAPAPTEAPTEDVPAQTQAPEETELTVTEPPYEENITAAEETSLASGTCGDDLTWVLAADGTLTISGTGPMADYFSSSYPWYKNRNSVLSVVVQEGVTGIGTHAFDNCRKITSVSLPSSLTEIRQYAFSECLDLVTCRIPENVTKIGAYAFYRCDDLTGNLVIPEGVTEIKDHAFYSCASLTGITMKGDVTKIEKLAFYGCTSAASVHIPETVTEIGEQAFSNCEGLTHVTIPAGLKTMGSSIFNFCKNLSSVTLSEGLTGIGQNMFSFCANLDGVIFPDSLERIGAGAFSDCDSLSRIVIPDSVTSLGENAFSGCKALSSAVVGNGVRAIEHSAFSNCENLTEVALGNAITFIGYAAFGNCKALSAITIPDSVTVLDMRVFASCESLTEIKIPDSVTTIGSYTFEDCKALTDVTLSQNLEAIDHGLFYRCNNLARVNIPGKIKYIGSYAFYGCTVMNDVTIPGTVAFIGECAFQNCDGITRISVPEGVTELIDTFAYCDNLTSVTLPNGLKKLKNTFKSCKALTFVNIPDTVTTIDTNAFFGCENLEPVTIPDSVTIISDDAFWGCKKWTVARIPGRVWYVGGGAFGGTNVTTAYLPKTVKTLSTSAFPSDLATLYYEGSEEDWKNLVGGYAHYYENVTIHYNTPMSVDDVYELKSDPEGPRLTLTSGETLELTLYLNRNEEPVSDWSAPVAMATAGSDILNLGEWTKSGSDWCLTVTGGKPGMEKLTITHADTGRELSLLVTVEPAPIREHIPNTGIRLNGPGSAYAFYHGSPYCTYSMTINGQGASIDSNGKGIIRVPLGSFSEEGSYSVKVTFTHIDGKPLDSQRHFDADITVLPLTYTQSWEVSLDTELGISIGAGGNWDIQDFSGEALLAGVTMGTGFGNVLNASMTYSGGKRTLELINDCAASPEVGFQSGISGEEVDLQFNILDISGNVSATTTGRYGLRFDNYSQEDKAQQLAIATFVMGAAAKVLPCDLMVNFLHDQLKFDEVYADCGAVVIEGDGVAFGKEGSEEVGGISIKRENSDVVVDGFSMVSAGKKTVASVFIQTDATGASQYSTNYTFSEKLGGGNVNFDGDTLALEYLGQDTTVAVLKNRYGTRTLETTSLRASETAVGNYKEGTRYDLDYLRLLFEGDTLGLLMNNLPNYAAYVSDRRFSVTDQDLTDLAKYLSSDEVMIPCENLKTEKTLQSKNVGFTAALGGGLDIGLGLSYLEATEYANENGFVYQDTFLVSGKSDSISSQVAANTLDLTQIIQTALNTMKEEIGKYFQTAGDNIANGVKNTYSEIKAKADSVKDWFVNLTHPVQEGDWLDSVTVAVKSKTRSAAGQANTVGRPIQVSVTDGEGNPLEDLSQEPLELTIRYTAVELEAAGIPDGTVAMYRYDKDTDTFEALSGKWDPKARTVTATIRQPGQYTLAAAEKAEGSEEVPENRLVLDPGELEGQSSVWIDGVEYALQEGCYVDLPHGNAKTMVLYGWQEGDTGDVHSRYPVSMKVWTLESREGIYTARRLEAMDDILQYSGCSIRVTGRPGIRMITSIEQEKKEALVSGGLAGYTLKEYGTLVSWADQLGSDTPLVLGREYVKSNYAFRKDTADPIFATEEGRIQYTNVLVGFGKEQCGDDLAIRPYLILEDGDGQELILYGGIVSRSIGYIALQNKDTFEKGTSAYNYVLSIIQSAYGEEYTP